ncbi:hypothetical protein SAMN05421866_0010 [Chryseobacterium oranimense]|uniref:Uncharacterized protein n=1 Tax=Chryseobacterium oranimense TaxID=421058 RepID=A0A1M5X6U4_9FLAO|nr:hypothetical protein [Chryseobacterium oranimense]SHH95535.1 hypothetical protein SAMN05421866_0010 [Chryseobacterium oranimense]
MKNKKIEITINQAKKFNLMIDALKEIRKQRTSKKKDEINEKWNVDETEYLKSLINNIQDISNVVLKNVKQIKI